MDFPPHVTQTGQVVNAHHQQSYSVPVIPDDRINWFPGQTGMVAEQSHHILVGVLPKQPEKAQGRRTIRKETWDRWEKDVYERYIISDRTLQQVMVHYKKTHGFPGTKKQWKDQMAKWQFRKRLNARDAAYICQQIRRGESNGRPCVVLFNGVEKTMSDIHAYIRKSKTIHGEVDLMKHFDPDKIPLHIVVKERAPPRTHNPGTGTLPGNAPNVPGMVHEDWENWINPEAVSLSSGESFVEVQKPEPEDIRPLSSDGSASGGYEGSGSDSDSSLHVPEVYDMDHATRNIAHQSIPDITGLMSNSPLQTDVDPERIEAKIDEWLGRSRTEPMGEDDASTQRALKFLRDCCRIAIHSGQECEKFSSYAQHASKEAVGAFCDIVRLHPWDSLTVLNHMVVLLSIYGHSYVPAEILTDIKNFLHNDPRGALDAPKSAILLALDFMLQLPYSKPQKSAYNLGNLEKMVSLAKQSFPSGSHDQFWLSATFIYAWALLEMKEPEKAHAILRDQKTECQQVFGRTKFQTINWIATLARAEAAVGKKTAAMNTYMDLFDARIAKQFSTEHPQFWDGKYRLACYIRKHVDALNLNEEERWKQRCDVARRLRETLDWRAQKLGRHNPITLQNQAAYRSVLKQLGLVDENSTFDQIAQTVLPAEYQ